LATWVSFTKRWAVWPKRGASRRGASHGTVGTTVFNLAQLLKAEAMEERALQVEQDAKEMAGPEAPAKQRSAKIVRNSNCRCAPRVCIDSAFSPKSRSQPARKSLSIPASESAAATRSGVAARASRTCTCWMVTGVSLLRAELPFPQRGRASLDRQRAADPCRRRVAARLQVPETYEMALRRPTCRGTINVR